MRPAGTPAQRVHLVRVPGSLFHDDAVHVPVGDIGQRIALYQCGIFCDDLQPVLLRKLDGSDDVRDRVSIGGVELDVLEALLPAALELLDQVAAPSGAARIDLSLAILLCRVRGGQIWSILLPLSLSLL